MFLFAERLLLATLLMDRSSRPRELSGGLNWPWCQQRGGKPERVDRASEPPGVSFGTIFWLCIQGHLREEIMPRCFLRQTTDLGLVL